MCSLPELVLGVSLPPSPSGTRGIMSRFEPVGCGEEACSINPSQIFESSRFVTELGAAIHLPPNVYGLLHRVGINPKEFNCNDAEFVRTRHRNLHMELKLTLVRNR